MSADLKECPFCASKARENEWPEGGEKGDVSCTNYDCMLAGAEIPIKDWNMGIIATLPVEKRPCTSIDYPTKVGVVSIGPRGTIAPPVATGNFRKLADMVPEVCLPGDFGIPDEYSKKAQAYADWFSHENAKKIAPPVAAGSVDTESRKLAVKFDKEARAQRERAEKAEAEVEFMKQVGMKEVEQANKVHARNLELEASVKKLEAALTRIGPFNITVD